MISESEHSDEVDELSEAVISLRVFTGMVLFCFADGVGQRDELIGRFVARGMACMESIHSLWRAGTEQDAWILHRSLLDRLFHLRALAENNDFENFEAYSFMAKYEARHRLLSDSNPIMRSKLPAHLKDLQKSNRQRYRELRDAGFSWHRPKAKDVAKEMGLDFLYMLGSDYASTHVHPMSDDRVADFERLTSPTQTSEPADMTVVENSLIAQNRAYTRGIQS